MAIASAGILRFAHGQSPLLLLPARLYEGAFPKAKSLVSRPLARFDGTLKVDGEAVAVQGWIGSQNHNWGRQHTDRYAWGQVSGFDGGHDESFLEVASAKLKIGPLWTPWITPIVLRHRGREHRLNALGRSLRARVSVQGFDWRFRSHSDDLRVQRSHPRRTRRVRRPALCQSTGRHQAVPEQQDRARRAHARPRRWHAGDAHQPAARCFRAARR